MNLLKAPKNIFIPTIKKEKTPPENSMKSEKDFVTETVDDYR